MGYDSILQYCNAMPMPRQLGRSERVPTTRIRQYGMGQRGAASVRHVSGGWLDLLHATPEHRQGLVDRRVEIEPEVSRGRLRAPAAIVWIQLARDFDNVDIGGAQAYLHDTSI